ncbi:AMP-binding protein [Paraburkholderia susongensis]|uniref:Anthranilate--CoA ligase n=1 Tax=Paraburkholderia susongensis TaxID=1515439 RepID=A0A1X7LH57_9BURK|nr:AMP-binding protein [Paraburkholderia susongensis]SMG53010.1 anthranilate--CoA ligase [Paraburkholderia susongensis]
MSYTAHIDTFARDRLPPREQQPEFLFDLPELRFPPRLNCAEALLDRWIEQGEAGRLCIQAPPDVSWTYGDLYEKANRIANVLVDEMGLVPGNRVLLRGANTPMLVACWFAVVKAGGIAVATMPLLRAKELTEVIDKAQVTHALCEKGFADELRSAAAAQPVLGQIRYYGGEVSGLEAGPETGLEAAMARQSSDFVNVPTAADDTCLIAFTSGTTGKPKGTMHFHRDVMAACACWPVHVLKADAHDRFVGSPPLAFTFGLGGLVLFPMSVGASTILLPKAGPEQLLEAIPRFGATVLFTAPTSYRAMSEGAAARRLSVPLGGTLRKCVSAGEVLAASVRALWGERTGIELIDGIGSTELLHIFVSADEDTARPGATGKAVPGYIACVMDEHGQPAPPGRVGLLAVKGPTGCRYLDDPRQSAYVMDGWNYTGDAYIADEDGYLYSQGRADDMIISAGYNIGAHEVEAALLQHPLVAECVVIGAADRERGQIVKAYVVLREGCDGGDSLAKELQDFVKANIAPYKYPRAIEFLAALPRTESGKVQRFRLREGSAAVSA